MERKIGNVAKAKDKAKEKRKTKKNSQKPEEKWMGIKRKGRERERKEEKRR